MAKEYNIPKTSSRCRKCNAEMPSGSELVALLRELAEDFQREDYCVACGTEIQAATGADVVGVWRSRVPAPQEKKKLFIDNDLLVNFFERLEGTEEPAKINFRFVLALVLMRKKLLAYDGRSKLPDGREKWKMHFRGTEQAAEVIDPHLDETMIAQTSEHLGEILEGEL